MRRNLFADLFAFAALLTGLSVVAHYLSPHSGAMTLPVGIGCAVTSALVGLLGFRNRIHRKLVLMIMAAVCVALTIQAVSTWVAIKHSAKSVEPASMIPTLLWVFGIVQWINLLQNRPSVLGGPGDRKSKE